MENIYFDRTENKGALGIFSKDAKLIPAGTTVYVMSVKENNAEYQRYEKEHDIKFIFDDNIPYMDFYAVPHIDIFAGDSLGGWFGTVEQITDFDVEAPICYIDLQKNCFLISECLSLFWDSMKAGSDWKADMQPLQDIKFYASKEEAQKKLTFFTNVKSPEKNKG